MHAVCSGLFVIITIIGVIVQGNPCLSIHIHHLYIHTSTRPSSITYLYTSTHPPQTPQKVQPPYPTTTTTAANPTNPATTPEARSSFPAAPIEGAAPIGDVVPVAVAGADVEGDADGVWEVDEAALGEAAAGDKALGAWGLGEAALGEAVAGLGEEVVFGGEVVLDEAVALDEEDTEPESDPAPDELCAAGLAVDDGALDS